MDRERVEDNRVFHNSRLIRQIEQEKNTQKIWRLDQELKPDCSYSNQAP